MPSKKAAEAKVKHWNETTPIGSRVRYWPGRREGEGVESKTRSEAWLLGGHSAVVQVEGRGGSIALTHVERIPCGDGVSSEG